MHIEASTEVSLETWLLVHDPFVRLAYGMYRKYVDFIAAGPQDFWNF